MINRNGFIVQALNAPTFYVKHINYKGINSYHMYPLSNIDDDFCRLLTQKQQSRKINENLYQSLEFISDYNLLEDYIECCKKYNIATRTLFIESSYSDEIYTDTLPRMKFIGYEYCPIPLDEQIITDFDWYPPLSRYHHKLNEYGLFDSPSDVSEFKTTYDQMCQNDGIGDDILDTYICKVFLVEELTR